MQQGGKTYPIYDPTTEEEITQIAEATAEDTEAAISAATVAFATWSKLSGQQREPTCSKSPTSSKSTGEELAYLQAKEMGRLFSDTMNVDIPDLAAQFRYYAGAASKIEGKVHQNVTNLLCYSRKEPIGVVAAITPFNFPLILSISKSPPRLPQVLRSSGNPLRRRPSPHSSSPKFW